MKKKTEKKERNGERPIFNICFVHAWILVQRMNCISRHVYKKLCQINFRLTKIEAHEIVVCPNEYFIFLLILSKFLYVGR